MPMDKRCCSWTVPHLLRHAASPSRRLTARSVPVRLWELLTGAAEAVDAHSVLLASHRDRISRGLPHAATSVVP